jgi:transcriptional regulator with XRE-family HTH domain
MTMSVSENMRNRRRALGITIAGMAQALGKAERQITKWEGEVTPPTVMLEPIARALNFSVSELLGLTPMGMDLSGTWHAIWNTTRGGLPVLNRHEMEAKHAGEFVYFHADGDYDWRMDARLRGTTLKGDYQAVSESRNESGTMHLILNHHGDIAIGHWAGEWADGIGGVGLGVIARDPDRAERMMKLLIDRDTLMITEWPREDQ